ncbi:MAG: glycosyltransferase family 2 protein [Pirellulales bacterium]|nr:glycosyltransferase family 2 protein [Pirellulales bacterium]
MSTEVTEATDVLFADSSDDATWPAEPPTSSQEVIERIDQTLDLIAEATSVAMGVRPIDHFDVTVIVPVFNGRSTLPKVLDRIDEVMPPATQVIVVDDGSADGTSQWLAEQPARESRTIIRRRGSHGKGSAVRLAIRHSVGRVVAIQDADLECDPADLLRVIWPILDGNADVVYGSRYLNGDDPSMLRRAGNWALTRLSNRITGLRLTDMETCHKAFDGDLLRSLSLRECRWGFEPEVTAKIAAGGAQVLEVPTEYQPRRDKEDKKSGWRDGLAALACMWKYRRG